MKTAISLPDALFAEADELAKRMSLSRSEFYALAVAEKVRRESDSTITERLNEVYASDDLTRPDPFVHEAARRVFAKSEW